MPKKFVSREPLDRNVNTSARIVKMVLTVKVIAVDASVHPDFRGSFVKNHVPRVHGELDASKNVIVQPASVTLPRVLVNVHQVVMERSVRKSAVHQDIGELPVIKDVPSNAPPDIVTPRRVRVLVHRENMAPPVISPVQRAHLERCVQRRVLLCATIRIATTKDVIQKPVNAYASLATIRWDVQNPAVLDSTGRIVWRNVRIALVAVKLRQGSASVPVLLAAGVAIAINSVLRANSARIVPSPAPVVQWGLTAILSMGSVFAWTAAKEKLATFRTILFRTFKFNRFVPRVDGVQTVRRLVNAKTVLSVIRTPVLVFVHPATLDTTVTNHVQRENSDKTVDLHVSAFMANAITDREHATVIRAGTTCNVICPVQRGIMERIVNTFAAATMGLSAIM